MNKNDLIAEVAGSAGLTRADAAKAVDSVFDTISGSLGRGTEVRLVGFGTFSVAQRKASQGRNPHTGRADSNSVLQTAQVQGGQGPEGGR